MKKTLSAARVVAALVFLLALSVSAMPQRAAAVYEDGSYTVPVSAEGLGRHNTLWSSASVTVEDGAIYADVTFERVDPRDHAPQFDWLRTSLGTFTPEIDDASFTCTFRRIRIADFGSVDVTIQTSAMSQPYELEYTLIFDGSSVPVKAEPAAVDEPEPEAPDDIPDDSPEPAAEEPSPEPEEPAPAESEPPADAEETAAPSVPSPADEPDDADPDETGEPVSGEVPLLIMPAPSGETDPDDIETGEAFVDEILETPAPAEETAEPMLPDGEPETGSDVPETSEDADESPAADGDADTDTDTDADVKDAEKTAEPVGGDTSAADSAVTTGAGASSSGGNTVIYIVIAAVAVIAVIAVICAVMKSRKKKG